MRSPIRSKNGQPEVALDTRGGLTKRAPKARQERAASRAPIDLRSSAERLATLILAQPIAKADVKAGRTPENSPRAFKDQGIRLRRNMVTSGPAGAELASAVTLAVTGQGGRILRTAERAHLDARPYLQRVGVYLATFVLNGMRVPAALVRAGSSAINEALADMILDHLVALDPTVIGATKSRVIDGARVTNTLPTFDAMMKLYLALRTQAGKDAALAIHLEGWGREQEREQSRRWDEQRWQAARAARAELVNTHDDERAELVHEDEDQDVTGGGPDLLPSAGDGEHGPRTGATLSHSPVRGDDSEEHEEPKSPHNATSREDGASPSELPALEPGAYCTKRKRMVPASLAGKSPPSAASGADWPERLKAENERIAIWERAKEREQMSAIAERSKGR